MNKLPCSYGNIYEGVFRYLPVLYVSFDKARDDDEQEHEHVDWCEDFIDPGWLLHSKGQKSWTSRQKTLL